MGSFCFIFTTVITQIHEHHHALQDTIGTNLVKPYKPGYIVYLVSL
jgi:hypothetical protein